MFNFKFTFSHPWLLLLLIPAFALSLLPHFRLLKKYRRNRNRIISLVCHIVVLVLCISVLAGIGISYDVYNSENEILLVVDASYSTKEAQDAKDSYIRDVIALANPEVYKIGIVTFGYDQQYAVPLTSELGDVYNQYLNSTVPDVSATDIAAALTYARGLFTNPETAKIVLISDGVETDEKASAVIHSIAAEGIAIDTVYCSTLTPEYEIQIVGAALPDYNVSIGEQFDIALTLRNSYSEKTGATLTLYDNGEPGAEVTVDLAEGVQTVIVPHSLTGTGLHQLRFEVKGAKDEVIENNTFCTYLYLESFDKILVLESIAGQSLPLEALLEDYDVTVMNIASEGLPMTLEGLRAYDEIILNNIANSDFPAGFDELLYEYVYEVGGGLFTVGGSEQDDPETAHAYNRADLADTLYQQMLPVQVIDYTPPLGLMIVIDVSGSMSTGTAGSVSRLQAAKDSARTIVRDSTCLTERDYCGIMTLSESYTEEINPLPLTRQDEILDAIDSIREGTSTVFTPAITYASQRLLSLYLGGKIEKMHVIVITDGAASDPDKYMGEIQVYHELGVTFSFVAVDPTTDSMSQLETAAEYGGGRAMKSTAGDLTQTLKDDIRVPAIKETEFGEYIPTIASGTYYASLVSQDEMPPLYGFYGTKARSDDMVYLSGDYGVPIYAQWKFGEGTVGSFLCDLDGTWSGDFLQADAGQRFLLGVINKLFPTQDIRPRKIEVRLKEDNYTTQMSIYTATELQEGETLSVRVQNLNAPDTDVRLVPPTAEDAFSRASFVTLNEGIYRIEVQRLGADGEVQESCVLYKAFSYSAEYDVLTEKTAPVEYMEALAHLGNGSTGDLESSPYGVFEGFVTSLHRTYDPRLALMIVAIVLFLLDIAVRKFKFKWIHEIIRERRAKKNDS